MRWAGGAGSISVSGSDEESSLIATVIRLWVREFREIAERIRVYRLLTCLRKDSAWPIQFCFVDSKGLQFSYKQDEGQANRILKKRVRMPRGLLTLPVVAVLERRRELE